VFVHGKPFQPSLMLVGEARSLPYSGAPVLLRMVKLARSLNGPIKSFFCEWTLYSHLKILLVLPFLIKRCSTLG
jgi:hypothetical protein